MKNIPTLLRTDVYKLGHEAQYPEGTTEIYSGLVARSNRWANASVVFGWSYYIKEYLLDGIKPGDAKLFMHYADAILGKGTVKPESFYALEKLGYWPVEIKSLPEGTLVKTGNIQATFESTDPRFPWAGGLLEGLLLKVWNSMTVATNSFRLRKVAELFADKTVGNRNHVPYQIHDFGYRGCSSEETAALGGAAHLLSFRGSDTIIGGVLLDMYYNADGNTAPADIASSVPASEHSVMTAFGRDHELEAFENMLTLYPTGIVSIVSDSYNLWNVLTTFVDALYDRILAREGTVVFRPDSGNPELILLGNPAAPEGSPERKGAYELLWDKFGGTTNELGYRTLNPKVSIIYGDGIYYERMLRIWVGLERKGFATLAPFGIGGLLLQQFSRDQLGFAFKATHVVVNGESRDVYKDPITDPGKKSFVGYVRVDIDPETGLHVTRDRVTKEEADGGELRILFRNGEEYFKQNLSQMRHNLETAVVPEGFAPTLDEVYAIADASAIERHYGEKPKAAVDERLSRFLTATNVGVDGLAPMPISQALRDILGMSPAEVENHFRQEFLLRKTADEIADSKLGDLTAAKTVAQAPKGPAAKPAPAKAK